MINRMAEFPGSLLRACRLNNLWPTYMRCQICLNNQCSNDLICNNKWAFLDNLRWRVSRCLNIIIRNLDLSRLTILLWMLSQVLEVTHQCLQIWVCILSQRVLSQTLCIVTCNNSSSTEVFLLQTTKWIRNSAISSKYNHLSWFNQV